MMSLGELTKVIGRAQKEATSRRVGIAMPKQYCWSEALEECRGGVPGGGGSSLEGRQIRIFNAMRMC